jgi:lipoate-protein ligase A
VRRLVGDAQELHAEPMPEAPRRAAWVLEATGPALVLGSTQGSELVDLDAARKLGVTVAKRRSGGGVVLVEPGNMVWVDVVVPAGDPLWDHDVGRAARWLGRAWQATLADLGIGATDVHDGPLACGPLGRLVCFGTVGAGEVTIIGKPGGTAAVRKVVGIGQRRTRAAARFQCAAYTSWDPAALARLLRLDDTACRVLADAAVGTNRDPGESVDAFLRNLPA